MTAAEKVAPPRAPLSDTDRHRLLRDAAEAVFLRDGYAAATMDEVARRAGMSKRTLYQLFPSKAALFEAVMEAHCAPFHIDIAIESEPDVAQELTALLEVAGRHLLTPHQIGIFRLIVAEGPRSPELATALHRAGPGRGAGALERRIAVEVAKGRLRVSSPETAARMLFGMAFGSIHIEMLLGLRGPPDDAEIVHRIREAVAVFLGGAAA